MKMKNIKKLDLDKIKVLKLSTMQTAAKDTLIPKNTVVSSPLTVCGASICICSWPTED